MNNIGSKGIPENQKQRYAWWIPRIIQRHRLKTSRLLLMMNCLGPDRRGPGVCLSLRYRCYLCIPYAINGKRGSKYVHRQERYCMPMPSMLYLDMYFIRTNTRSEIRKHYQIQSFIGIKVWEIWWWEVQRVLQILSIHQRIDVLRPLDIWKKWW